MILPSENTNGNTVGTKTRTSAAMRLWNTELGRGGDASRLEFQTIQWPGTEQVEVVGASEEAANLEVDYREQMEALDVRLQSRTLEASTQLEQARRETRAEARAEWEDELEQRVASERIIVLRISEQFVKERGKYFAEVEKEVVKLALSIAARVLHREAELDPLLLTAVVRVALEKISEDSATTLRVPVVEVEMWQDALARGPGAVLQVLGDERLEAGDCVLESNVGTVELGIRAQLSEIERGFFDLLRQRPA
jgi:flagellar assembly protein FliH